MLQGFLCQPTSGALPCGMVTCCCSPCLWPARPAGQVFQGCCLVWEACLTHGAMAAMQLCKVKALCHLRAALGMSSCLAPELLPHILLQLLLQGCGVEGLVDTVLPGIALGIYPSVWLGGVAQPKLWRPSCKAAMGPLAVAHFALGLTLRRA